MPRETSLTPLLVAGGIVTILGFATLLWSITFFLPVLPPSEEFFRNDNLRSFNGTLAFEYARYQCEDIGYRYPGSVEIEKTRLFIHSIIEKLPDWTITFQNFTYRNVSVVNLIADWKGYDSEGEITILGAHYDTRFRANKDYLQPEEPVMGANDGASGVAVLLELARVIQEQDFHINIRLLFFDAEDQGSGGMDGWSWIVGSQYYADYLDNNELVDTITRMILVDMVGDADLQIYKESYSDSGLVEDIWNVAAEIGATAFIPTYNYWILDDHIPFKNLGIPSIDIIDFDYPYHHTTRDTLDKISKNSMLQVGKTIEI
ncbi:MAG: M28 family peptidase, partial [Candidatus Hodarchaeales archaeon]